MNTSRFARAFLLTVALLLSSLTLPSFDPSTNLHNGTAAWAKLGRRGKFTETPSEEHYNEGLRRIKGEDYEGAVDALLQAIYFARNGYYPDAYYWLGIAYMGKNDDSKAIGALETCTKQSVEEPTEAWLSLAEVHLRNDRYDECEKAIRSIKAYDRTTRQKIQYVEGLKWDKKGEYMAAEHAYRDSMGDKPWKNGRVWTLMCEAIMKQKRWQDALREFQKIIDLDYPLQKLNNARLWHDVGLCRLAIGDHQGAIDSWKRSLDYDGKNAEVWLNLAMLLESEKHYSSCLQYFKEFIRLANPKDPRVQQAKDKITKIEQGLRPNDTMPEQANPSQYMRQQMGDRVRQQNSQMQQQMQPRRTDESGF